MIEALAYPLEKSYWFVITDISMPRLSGIGHESICKWLQPGDFHFGLC
jgi:YesN/AraC family two-component response regulator